MTVLLEVHDEEELQAIDVFVRWPNGRSLLGINNRDLHAQRTDLATTMRLAALLPPGTPFVSESGITTRDDALRVQRAGACAILVGESLPKSGDIGPQIDSLPGRTL